MFTDWTFSEFFEGQAIRVWIQIMAVVWVLALIWITAMLFRGGFTDIRDTLRSPYTTHAERRKARGQLPARVLALFAAAFFGATTTALTLWFQGAFAIFFWRQLTGG